MVKATREQSSANLVLNMEIVGEHVGPLGKNGSTPVTFSNTGRRVSSAEELPFSPTSPDQPDQESEIGTPR